MEGWCEQGSRGAEVQGSRGAGVRRCKGDRDRGNGGMEVVLYGSDFSLGEKSFYKAKNILDHCQLSKYFLVDNINSFSVNWTDIRPLAVLTK